MSNLVLLGASNAPINFLSTCPITLIRSRVDLDRELKLDAADRIVLKDRIAGEP
jgi:hypothetical protein